MSMNRIGVSRLGLGVLAAALVATTAGVSGQPAVNRGTFGAPGAGGWVTAWATSQQALGDTSVSNATVRLIARVTVPGETVRIRLDNGYGADSVRIGRASIAYRVQGPLVAAGSSKPLTFGGATDAILPPGGTLWSDPVAMPVLAQQDLAVSLFLPGSNIRPSQHTNAVVTSYRTANGAGDKTADETRTPFTETFTATWWLKAVEVQAAAGGAAGAIVAFGDSITDGTCTTLDANDRWVNILSTRLGLEYDAAVRGGRAATLKAVINEGIGGNTVNRDVQPLPDSTPAVERLERDVLSHHGVTDVIVFIGTNDLRREATVAAVTEGLASIVKRIKAAAAGGSVPRVHGVTMIPRHNVAASGTNTGWNDEKSRRRREVNEWIRKQGGFDDVIDFDAMVRDAKQPDLIASPLNCGDGIHPSPAGYYTIGRAISIGIFDASR